MPIFIQYKPDNKFDTIKSRKKGSLITILNEYVHNELILHQI